MEEKNKRTANKPVAVISQWLHEASAILIETCTFFSTPKHLSCVFLAAGIYNEEFGDLQRLAKNSLDSRIPKFANLKSTLYRHRKLNSLNLPVTSENNKLVERSRQRGSISQDDTAFVNKILLSNKARIIDSGKIRPPSDKVWKQIKKENGLRKSSKAIYTLVSCNRWGIRNALGVGARNYDYETNLYTTDELLNWCKVEEDESDALILRFRITYYCFNVNHQNPNRPLSAHAIEHNFTKLEDGFILKGVYSINKILLIMRKN